MSLAYSWYVVKCQNYHTFSTSELVTLITSVWHVTKLLNIFQLHLAEWVKRICEGDSFWQWPLVAECELLVLFSRETPVITTLKLWISVHTGARGCDVLTCMFFLMCCTCLKWYCAHWCWAQAALGIVAQSLRSLAWGVCLCVIIILHMCIGDGNTVCVLLIGIAVYVHAKTYNAGIYFGVFSLTSPSLLGLQKEKLSSHSHCMHYGENGQQFYSTLLPLWLEMVEFGQLLNCLMKSWVCTFNTDYTHTITN